MLRLLLGDAGRESERLVLCVVLLNVRVGLGAIVGSDTTWIFIFPHLYDNILMGNILNVLHFRQSYGSLLLTSIAAFHIQPRHLRPFNRETDQCFCSDSDPEIGNELPVAACTDSLESNFKSGRIPTVRQFARLVSQAADAAASRSVPKAAERATSQSISDLPS